MPLLKGKKATTKKGRQKNIQTEIDAGKDPKQAVAIGYSIERKEKSKLAAKKRKKTVAKKAPAKKSTTKKTAAKKTTTRKKTAVKKTTAKKSTAKRKTTRKSTTTKK